MKQKRYLPSHTDKVAASAKSKRDSMASFVKIKNASKPVYISKFRLSRERLEEIARSCEEALLTIPFDENKQFTKW